MPHIFKIECYRKRHDAGKAAIGDVVYLKSRPDVAMTVCHAEPDCNKAAGHTPIIKVRYLGHDLQPILAEFKAEELSS